MVEDGELSWCDAEVAVVFEIDGEGGVGVLVVGSDGAGILLWSMAEFYREGGIVRGRSYDPVGVVDGEGGACVCVVVVGVSDEDDIVFAVFAHDEPGTAA